jgi:hypothetical protein
MLLKQGSSGKEVKLLQIYLDSIGYKIKASGYFDFITYLCVKDFQRHTKIKVDGIVGPITQAHIKVNPPEVYCPEVFEHILGLEESSVNQVEKALKYDLAGLGDSFYSWASIYDVKWTHVVAHAALESAWGTSYIARKKNNLFGFMAYDSSPFASAKKFKSFEDCIRFWIPWWGKYYLLPTGKFYNGDSEYGVNKRYATSPIAGISKAFLVRSIRQAANS